jgi:hypothetical protein
LPATSRLATALRGGKPQWTTTDHLLADLWVLFVRIHSPKRSLPDDFDHPARAQMSAQARAEHMTALKAKFRKRRADRAAAHGMNPR